MRARALIHNPAAGSRRGGARLQRIVEILAAGGHRVQVLPTTAPGQASELCARFLSDAGPDADVVVLGGDGTLNEAVTGAFDAGFLREVAVEGAGPRFGVLPGGTTNVVARDLGLPWDPVAAARAIAAGRTRVVDVGTCSAGGRTRPFLLACGVGIDAEAARRVRPITKRLVGRAAYWTALVGALRQSWSLSVDHEGPAGCFRDVAAASVIVGNTKLYAGCVRLRAGSSLDDGLLDLVLLPTTSFGSLFRAGLTGLFGSVKLAAGACAVAATRVVVSQAPGGDLQPAPLHVDAEPWGRLPAELGILPRRLAVLVP